MKPDELVMGLKKASLYFAKFSDRKSMTDLLAKAADALEEMKVECFRLAAGMCIVDGGLIGDEGGTPCCVLKAALEESQKELGRVYNQATEYAERSNYMESRFLQKDWPDDAKEAISLLCRAGRMDFEAREKCEAELTRVKGEVPCPDCQRLWPVRHSESCSTCKASKKKYNVEKAKGEL